METGVGPVTSQLNAVRAVSRGIGVRSGFRCFRAGWVSLLTTTDGSLRAEGTTTRQGGHNSYYETATELLRYCYRNYYDRSCSDPFWVII